MFFKKRLSNTCSPHSETEKRNLRSKFPGDEIKRIEKGEDDETEPQKRRSPCGGNPPGNDISAVAIGEAPDQR